MYGTHTITTQKLQTVIKVRFLTHPVLVLTLMTVGRRWAYKFSDLNRQPLSAVEASRSAPAAVQPHLSVKHLASKQPKS